MALKTKKPIEVNQEDAIKLLDILQIQPISNIENVNVFFIHTDRYTGDPQVFIQTNDDEVYGHGSNLWGILGDGHDLPMLDGRPKRISALSDQDIVQFKTAESHVLALKSNGKVLAWGLNHKGQLGDGSIIDRMTPALVIFPSHNDRQPFIISIDCNGFTSCSLTKEYTIYVFGSNASGQLGTGKRDNDSHPYPVKVDLRLRAPAKVLRLECGGSSMMAMTDGFELFTWGKEFPPINHHVTGPIRLPFIHRGSKTITFCAASTICAAIVSDQEADTSHLYVWGAFNSKFSNLYQVKHDQVPVVTDLIPGDGGFAAVGENGRILIFKPDRPSHSPIVVNSLQAYLLMALNERLAISFQVIDPPSPPSPDSSLQDEARPSPSQLEKQLVEQQRAIKEISYRMDYPRRGQCLIFNQSEFPDSSNLKPCNGYKDAFDLDRVFKKLGFDVSRYDNLTKDDILAKLDEVSMANHSEADCFACCILTHGRKDDELYASDGGVISVSQIITKFQTDRSPTLAGKPKIFIIEACRGNLRETETQMNPTANGQPPITKVQLPRQSDLLLCHSTYPGYVSWIRLTHGSWFIQELCKAIEAQGIPAPGKHICDLATLVTMTQQAVSQNYRGRSETQTDHQLAKRAKTDEEIIQKQMPVHKSTLRKRLYFWPKVNSTNEGEAEPIYA